MVTKLLLTSAQGASFWFGHGKLELGTATGYIHDVWAKTIKNPHPHFYRYLGFGGEEKVISISAEASCQIMNNEAFEMPYWFREGSKPLLGDGLISAEGAAHKVIQLRSRLEQFLITIHRSYERRSLRHSVQPKFAPSFLTSGKSA